MTYGTPAYGGLIDTGKARENLAFPREDACPGPTAVLQLPPIPAGARSAGCVCCQCQPSQVSALHWHWADQMSQLTGASLSTPELNF